MLLKLRLYIWGAILVIVALFVLCLIVIGAYTSAISQSSVQQDYSNECGELNGVTENVMSYAPLVLKELDNQGLSTEYTNCLLAQMMQESGGNPPDVFQASESKYGYIGGIKTVEESIEQGVKRWVEIKKEIDGYENLTFNVDLLLQTYNFGSNYARWLSKLGSNHTEELAYEYSVYMAKRLNQPNLYRCHSVHQNGEACYGDFQYVAHVRRYLVNDGSIISPDNPQSGYFQVPYPNLHFRVTSDFKMRWGRMHQGIDLVAYHNAPVSASADGEIVDSRYSDSYGNLVTIKHDNGLYTRYAHLENRYAKVGNKVKQGQVIGTQGNTGRSYGSHLHFEIRKANDYNANSAINPRNYLELPKEGQ
ncbi:hypothetical protein E2L07_20075 [Halalkalibacterium halodurans]|uniref:lysozyme family protein n=1 Tax=Halalkalibacterium halodurans TaxID=86665 RepID=UPI0010680E9C|nr:lysozyme family protein [Halalkalibacterium halodurans]TES45894.1 hypothetical protein E2L07_20075 [Halalkalibacterium halodurans]